MNQDLNLCLRQHTLYFRHQFTTRKEVEKFLQYFKTPNLVFEKYYDCPVARKIFDCFCLQQNPNQDLTNVDHVKILAPPRELDPTTPLINSTHPPDELPIRQKSVYEANYIDTDTVLCSTCQHNLDNYQRVPYAITNKECKNGKKCDYVLSSMDMAAIFKSSTKSPLYNMPCYIVYTQTPFIYRPAKTHVPDEKHRLIILPKLSNMAQEVKKNFEAIIRNDLLKPLYIIAEILQPGSVSLHKVHQKNEYIKKKSATEDIFFSVLNKHLATPSAHALEQYFKEFKNKLHLYNKTLECYSNYKQLRLLADQVFKEAVILKKMVTYSNDTKQWVVCEATLAAFETIFKHTGKKMENDSMSKVDAFSLVFNRIMRLFYEVTSKFFDFENHQGYNTKQALQGKDSQMRRSILSPMLNCIRAQTLIRPELLPHQIILPQTEMHRFHSILKNQKVQLFDLTNPAKQDVFIRLPVHMVLLGKRDPILKTPLIFTEVAFANTNMFYMSALCSQAPNHDQDGDTIAVHLVDTLNESFELRTNLDPEINNQIGYNSDSRYSFIENAVLVLYECTIKRNARLVNFPNVDLHTLFEKFKHVYTCFWVNIGANFELICTLEKMLPFDIQTSDVEFTYGIIRKFLEFITGLYGTFESYNLMVRINYDCCNLIYEPEKETLVIDTLGRSRLYTFDPALEPTLANRTFFELCMSGARGSLSHYIDLLNLIKTANGFMINENETKISRQERSLHFRLDGENRVKRDPKEMTATMERHIAMLGKSSQMVPQIGYENFRNAIRLHTVNYWNKHLIINDKDMGKFNLVTPFTYFDEISIYTLFGKCN